MDGKGVNGKNQSILIPKNSNVKTIEELKGKTISTPIGSSAHYMLMKVLEKHNILDDVKIVHQDVALSNQLLSTNKTDVFSIWAPYPNFLEKEAKKILKLKDKNLKKFVKGYNDAVVNKDLTYYSQRIDDKLVFLTRQDDNSIGLVTNVNSNVRNKESLCHFCR